MMNIHRQGGGASGVRVRIYVSERVNECVRGVNDWRDSLARLRVIKQ